MPEVQNTRIRVESFLRSYPYLIESISALVFGLIFAGSGFGAGFALGRVKVAIVLAIAGAIVGSVLGWLLANLALVVVLAVLLAIFPDSWIVVVLSALVAMVISAVQLAMGRLDLVGATICSLVLYLLFLIGCNIVVSMCQFAVRIVNWFSQRMRRRKRDQVTNS